MCVLPGVIVGTFHYYIVIITR